MHATRLRNEILLGLLILAAAGWLRLRELDHYIVSDETRWVCRSVNFRSALSERDWAGTFQSGHPGVVTMWLGSLALDAETIGHWHGLCLNETNGGENTDHLDNVGMEGVYQTLTPVIFAARRGIAVGSLLGLLVVYLLLRAGLGLRAPPALAGIAILAFDPYLLAHSRVMHLDAMLAILSLAAVLGLASWLRRADTAAANRWAGLAGALAGLAMLAKSAGFLLGPFALIVFAGWAWRRRQPVAAARAFLIWGLAAALAYGLLWPSMWVDPIGSLARDCDEPCRAGVLFKAHDEGGQPHQSGNYFMGRAVADPGPGFYPVAGSLRLAPLGLIGALFALGLALRAARARAAESDALGARSPADALALWALLGWALVFGLIISFEPKKFDRYLLPSLAALNLAGGLALASLAPALGRARRAWWSRRPASRPSLEATGLGAGLAIVLLLGGLQFLEATSARAWPYPITYYNPLLGGAQRAEHVLLMGWGEGYDQAARYLNGLPEAEKLEAASKGVANFGPLFVGRFRSAPGFRPGRTDYVVIYKSQVQRRQEPISLLETYYDPPDSQPVFTGVINGIEMVWVYPNATVPPLRERLSELATPGDLVIAGGETVLAKHWDAKLPLFRYWGHWGTAEIEADLLPTLPAAWTRAWVVRYPGYDPPAVLEVLEGIATRGEIHQIVYDDDSVVEITGFTRNLGP